MYSKILFMSIIIFFFGNVFGMESFKRSGSVSTFISEGDSSQSSSDSDIHEEQKIQAQKSFNTVTSRINSVHQAMTKRAESGKDLFEPDMAEGVYDEIFKHNQQYGTLLKISDEQVKQWVTEQPSLTSLTRKESVPLILLVSKPVDSRIVFQFLKGEKQFADIVKIVDDYLSNR